MLAIKRTMLMACLGMVFPLSAAADPACAPTRTVAAQNYPSAARIPPSNNLLLMAGKALPAEGQTLIIKGRVLDTRCMPVSEAVVELWQNSPTGKWLLATAQDAASPVPVFAGAGRTYTDKDGAFTFITAFPAPLGKRAPFVNVKVMRDAMPTLSTALFFANDARNDGDVSYRKVAAGARQDTTLRMSQSEGGDIVGEVDLVLPAKVPFRTY